MKGLLIYDSEGISRNRWFAEELIKTANRYKIDLELVIADGGEPFSCGSLPDFAVVRTIAPQINRYLEECGVRVFNNYKTSKYANDKWLTYRLANTLGIKTMLTQKPNNGKETLPLGYPFVLKSLNGHGGKEVYKVASEAEYLNLADRFKDNYIIQELCSDEGKDVRVYCLGENIVLAMLRTSSSDFRSNFSLGGKAEVFEPTAYMREVVKALRKELDFGLVGIDFISHKGEWALNEIEDVVGTRMIYRYTDVNIIDKYVRYIMERLND